MASDAIIDNRLLIRLDLDHSLRANTFFQTDVVNRSHLMSQLLLYETVIIPTFDFGIIPILINWFGLHNFEEILDSSTIKFVKRNDFLGYEGNGNGLVTFTIRPGADKVFEWWQEAIFGDSIATSIELQLMHLCPFISGKQRRNITEKIISLSNEIIYKDDFFKKNIADESYTDISHNEKLEETLLSFPGIKSNRVDLTRLPGDADNQIRVLRQEGIIKDQIDFVLRIAEINLEIIMATEVGNVDIFTSEGADEILRGKLTKYKIDKTVLDSFISLLEINNIPDIRQAISAGAIEISTLWTLRNTKNAKLFRKWLREANPQNGRDLEKEYVRVLGKTTLADSLPVRTIRFAITTLAGIEPIIGLAVGAMDNYFVDKWLAGYTPKLLLDELSKLLKDEKDF